MPLLRAAVALIAFLGALNVCADSWQFPKKRVEQKYTFGETQIIKITDGTRDQTRPRRLIKLFHRGELRAQLAGVGFQQIFASPDNAVFVALSNSGLDHAAAMVFTNQGEVTLLAHHGIAELDYCGRSISIVRDWYDAKNPDVQFTSMGEPRGVGAITIRDCRGETVNLFATIMDAYKRALETSAQRNWRR